MPIAPEPPAMKSDPSTGAELQVWLPNEKDAPPAKIELAPESAHGMMGHCDQAGYYVER